MVMAQGCSSIPVKLEDARAIILEHVSALSAESVSIIESLGRVLAQDVASDIDISPFDNSAMDGFAVRYEDFEAAGASEDAPLTLAIIGHIGAGEVYEATLQSGEALRIMTGAPLPKGADTVVKIEDTQVLGETAEKPEGSQVVFTQIPESGEHVRAKGEEARKGEVLLHTGERITSPGSGLLASTGNANVLVYRHPRVAIISTGSELVAVTDIPGPGQIRNSNSYSIATAVIEAGGIPTVLPTVIDTREALKEGLLAAIAEHDFVVTSGGAAEGDFDFITPAVREMGELFFNKVNMKPGKAQTFGVIEGTPIFGLPGNPTAASVGFELLIRPALHKMQGLELRTRPITKAILKQDVKKKEPRRFYLRGKLEKDQDGQYSVVLAPNQSSALLGILNRSNCLLIVPEGDRSLKAGELVDCLRLDMEEGVI
jgi:molybdopterin molybdotransferase